VQTGASRGDATILLVERNDALRLAIAKLLNRHGYCVLEARESREALRFADGNESPDLLIGEFEPGLVERLEHMRPMIRVLDWGGYQEEPKGRALSLRKPFEPQTLLTAVRVLLARDVCLDETL
jgi:DNA-binding NtrC family response regulator